MADKPETTEAPNGPMVPLYLVLGPAGAVGLAAASTHGSGEAIFGAAVAAAVWVVIETVRRGL